MLWSLVDRSCCLRSLGIVTRKKQKKQSCSGDGEGEGDQPAVVHVGDGGVGLGVLREADKAEAKKAETTAATGVTPSRRSTQVSNCCEGGGDGGDLRPLGPDRTPTELLALGAEGPS